MLNRIYNLFWSERIWLYTGVRWVDIAEHNNAYHLLWVLPFLGFICLLREFVHKYLLAFGKYLGVKEKKLRNMPPNEKLEEIYRNYRSRKFNVYEIAKQLDMSEREVDRWWRLRRSHDKPSNLIKFTEYMFKACFYFFTSVLGLYLIWDKEWAWNLSLLLKDYPHYNIETNLKCYYMLAISYYFYIILNLYKDMRRKDLLLMFTHHALAIFMCVTCWITHLYRIATLCLVLQDQADCLLHLVKAMRTANLKLLYWIAFILFFINWFITRMYIYPAFILTWTFNELWTSLETEIYILGVTYFIVLFFIFLLQLYWTWLILLVVYNFIITKEARDVRSSTSESSDKSQNLERNN